MEQMPLFFSVIIALAVIGSSHGIEQPDVTIIEQKPSRQAVGSLSMPEGSPWCDGKPTYWLVGHQNIDETPWCLNGNGKWEQPFNAVLDPRTPDRHDCANIDVNHDGLPDVQCVVGAGKGTGSGYNELYITQPDGSLDRIPNGGGLQKYPSLRTRRLVTLTDANGDDLLFISVKGKPRDDGRPNTSRMFKNIWKLGDDPDGPYFEEVRGPWIQNMEVKCVITADVNQDGLDDLIVCNGHHFKPSIFIQKRDGSWDSVDLPDGNSYLVKWRSVRVGDLTGDGIPDVAVVKSGEQEGALHIFRGTGGGAPYFDFSRPVLQVDLPHATPDVELFDVNGDDLLDIYVVQTDETQTSDTYCTRARDEVGPVWTWWGADPDGPYVPPPTSWVPPLDTARDVLFVANEDYSYEQNSMTHSYPGCGGIVEKFGDKTLILAQGTFVHPGYNLLLKW